MILKFLTPINLRREKKRFFASKNYHPVFEYKWGYRNDTFAKSKYKKLIQLCVDQNIDEIVKEGKRLFEVDITKERERNAQNIINATRVRRLRQISLERISEMFNSGFKFLNLDWSLELGGFGFNFRPCYKRKVLLVGRDISLEFMSVEGEVRHELLHITRYENGVFNSIKKSKNYLPTEEGLASYMHDFKGQEENYSLFQHAAEYMATKVALNGTLRDVIEFFLSIGFSRDLAWQRGIRHKFGIVDTRESGDLMKPAMYFFHEMKIREELDDRDRLRLMVGKIGYDDLETFNTYSGKVDREKLIEFYKLELD